MPLVPVIELGAGGLIIKASVASNAAKAAAYPAAAAWPEIGDLVAPERTL
jgi:hypothetical protein